MCKSSALGFVLIFAFLFRLEQPSWRLVLIIAIMTLGVVILGAIVLLALLAPLISPHDPFAQDVSRRLVPPVWFEKGEWTHLLGTDKLGRDYLSRLIYGSQISLLIGLSAGFFGGVIEEALMGITNVVITIPSIVVLILLSIAIDSRSIYAIAFIIGVTSWPWTARAVRAQALVANDDEAAILVKEIATLPPAQRLPVIRHWGVTGGNFVVQAGPALQQVLFGSPDLQLFQCRLHPC